MTAEMITLSLQHVAHFNEQTLHFLSVMPMRMNFNSSNHQDLVTRGNKIALIFFSALSITMIMVLCCTSVVYKCVVNMEPDEKKNSMYKCFISKVSGRK